jgi:hypothetical protein
LTSKLKDPPPFQTSIILKAQEVNNDNDLKSDEVDQDHGNSNANEQVPFDDGRLTSKQKDPPPFNDVLNCTEVCSRELGQTAMEYIGLYGWTFTRCCATTGNAHIEYQQLEACLTIHLGGNETLLFYA